MHLKRNMVRGLVWVYTLIQLCFLIKLNWHVSPFMTVLAENVPPLDLLKIAEIVVLPPILFILAKRTRELLDMENKKKKK